MNKAYILSLSLYQEKMLQEINYLQQTQSFENALELMIANNKDTFELIINNYSNHLELV